MMDGGQRADGASAAGGRLPIIIVCSTSDLEIGDAAAAGLRTRGYDVALLGAAEEGPIRLVEVADRFERQGLYVLCRGGELDRDAVERLRSTLRSMDVPFGRTLTLATGQGGARALEERVVSVARRMVTGRYERAASRVEETPEEEGVFVTGTDIDRWADSLAGGQIQPPDPSRPIDLPTAVVGAPIGGPAPSNPAPGTGPGTAPGVAVAADDYEPVDKTLVARHPIPEIAQREESSAPSPASVSDDDISASAFSSGPNMRWIAAGGVALVLIIALAIALSGDDPEPASDTVAARDEGAQQAEAEPEEAEPEEAEPEPEPEEEAEVPEEAVEAEPAEEAEDEPTEPVAAEETPSVDEQLADLDLEGAEKSLSHRSMVDVALLDDRPLPPSAPRDRAAIAAALADREIRSWNAFLLAGEDAPEMTYSDAETFCKTLIAGDIAGWRLPSIGELLSLSEAKMLERKGIYWSETPGDAFGDTRIVVNVRKGSTAPVRTDWDGAKPICVRVRE